MTQQLSLTLNSTLADLASHNYQVSSVTRSDIVAKELYQNPELPGVLIIDDSELIGMISRSKFLEKIYLPNWEEIYSNHPIQKLLDFTRIPPLMLSSDTPINEAVQLAMNRSINLIYEPIVLICDHHEFRLIDFRILCQAQTLILQKSRQIIEQQEQTKQKYFNLLNQEKQRINEANHNLNIEKNIMKKLYQSRFAERENAINQHYQKILKIYQEIVQTGRLVSKESHREFHAIFIGANSIHKNSEDLESVIKNISRDLETINSASTIMAEIVQKVRYLSVQASVLTYQQSSTNQTVLSQINLEMNRLVKQTLDLSQQMNNVSSHFKVHINNLKDIAHKEDEVTRKMILNTQRAEMAIAELDQLLENPNLGLTNLIPNLSNNN
ncbi:chemotaxis protein [Limnospira platensis CENA597]|uniref:chemotaxis protein n=1 Tax=Limnospira platensis TaxID=118562 RepID=UPI003D6EB7F6